MISILKVDSNAKSLFLMIFSMSLLRVSFVTITVSFVTITVSFTVKMAKETVIVTKETLKSDVLKGLKVVLFDIMLLIDTSLIYGRSVKKRP